MSHRPPHTPANIPARQKLQDSAQQQRAAQLRRRGIFAAVALTVVAAATAVGIAVGTQHSATGTAKSNDTNATVGNKTSPTPAHASGADGTVVVYGDPNAKRTLEVYEDFRCPVCKMLEATDGATITHSADQGTYKIAYHLGAFLDGNLGGSGSMQALAAAGAALNESPKLFKEFHDVLYANQPEETSDDFSNQQHLLDLAAKVPGLVTPQFTKDVKDGTYLGWAQRVTDAFTASGVTGTPTLKLDGKTLNVFTNSGPITPDQFRQLIG
ncbi:protein-disulfide isomerase [Streptacidiphilus sp. MAP12-20]|uniref:DsbA family protein n=1 Tax=Streptacidiphilus sp. MAP12-20 TaxID=3156299 RepID=UPI0035149632